MPWHKAAQSSNKSQYHFFHAGRRACRIDGQPRGPPRIKPPVRSCRTCLRREGGC